MAARKSRAGVPSMPSIPAYHRYFAPTGPWGGVTEYGSQTSKTMVSFARSFGKNRPDRSWATRLLERVGAGERICNRGIENAREVVAREVVGTVEEREPGSDDEG